MYMLKYDPFAVGKLFPRSWEHNNPPGTSSYPRLEFVISMVIPGQDLNGVK